MQSWSALHRPSVRAYFQGWHARNLLHAHNVPASFTSDDGAKLPTNSRSENSIPKTSFRNSDNCSSSSCFDPLFVYRLVNKVLPLRSKMIIECTPMVCWVSMKASSREVWQHGRGLNVNCYRYINPRMVHVLQVLRFTIRIGWY